MNDNNNISAEDRHKVYELCKTYLSGEWAQINEEDLFIEKIMGGYINQVFICGLPENGNTSDNKVVVRLEVPDLEEVVKEFKSETHILAMNVILSNKNIAPKLICAFNGGLISQYIESRSFGYLDDQDSIRTQLLASKLAQLNSMKMPIPKITGMDKFKSNTPMLLDLVKTYKEKVIPYLQKTEFEFLSKFKFVEEREWLIKVIDDIKSPVVFSHNDMNKNNILVKDSKQLEIFLIDFDWSSYNLRGVDLGKYFSNWGHISTDFGTGDFPTDEQMSVFIEAYIKEMCKIFGDSFAEQEINSKERLIKEAKIFALFGYISEFMSCLFQFEQDNNIMVRGEKRMKLYGALKERILQEYNL